MCPRCGLFQETVEHCLFASRPSNKLALSSPHALIPSITFKSNQDNLYFNFHTGVNTPLLSAIYVWEYIYTTRIMRKQIIFQGANNNPTNHKLLFLYRLSQAQSRLSPSPGRKILQQMVKWGYRPTRHHKPQQESPYWFLIWFISSHNYLSHSPHTSFMGRDTVSCTGHHHSLNCTGEAALPSRITGFTAHIHSPL